VLTITALIVGAIVGTIAMVVAMVSAWGQIRSIHSRIDDKASLTSIGFLDHRIEFLEAASKFSNRAYSPKPKADEESK
jgi:hypothetical protein